MANLEAVKRTVNTANRPCPLRLAERCPGERSGCAFWLAETFTSEGRTEVVEGCMFAFQYVMSHEIALESVRMQASLDKTSTTMRDTGKGLMTVIAASGRRALRGE